MRIARFVFSGKESYGLVENGKIKGITGPPWESIQLTGEGYNLDSVKLLPPVQPPDIIAIGLNYKAHADEGGDKYPTAPVVFVKLSSSVVGPNDDIVLPAMAPNFVDYEAELAVVIGKKCRNVSEADALDYVLGYTIGNDVSARDCQIKIDIQWARGKSFDTFCPIGPWIETDLNPDSLNISLKLNGETMQSGNTSDMIFSCAKLVSYCSQIATLKPGTIIMTGTTAGVGYSRSPQVLLRAGDKVEIEIEGIGTLVNNVVNE